jgi:hypothetical protein
MKIRLLLLLLPLLIAGCQPEAITPNPAATLLGFGDTEGTVNVTGETREVTIFWTKATTATEQLIFTLIGDQVGPDELEVLTPSPLTVPAGTTEISLQVRAAPGSDPEQLEAGGKIVLSSGDWFRLSDRDTFTFGFSVPHTVRLDLWASGGAFPKLWGYTSFNADPIPDGAGLAAGRHFCFSHKSRTEPNVIGLYNTSPGRNTNALNLIRIYADFEVSTGSANIRIPSMFRLIPTQEGATSGIVEVIDQRITIVRRSSSGLPPFTVGLSGSGTYNELTGILLANIIFDESELGFPAPILRRYSYEAQER